MKLLLVDDNIQTKRDLVQAFEDHPEEFNIVDRVIFPLSRQGRPTRAQLRMARQFDRDIIKFERQFRIDILKALNDFGEEVERATLEVLEGEKDVTLFGYKVNVRIGQKIANEKNTWEDILGFVHNVIDQSRKDASQDAMDAALIASTLNTEKIINDLTIVYEKHYERIAQATQENISATLNLGISIVDQTEAVILSEGGKRVGLLDIPGKTKRKIFEQLSEGRLEGESVPQLARRLRDFIPSGRFKKSSTRATLIARTETVNAQRESAIATYQENRVTEVLILDARKGPTDIDCETWNGQIVSLEMGQRLVQDEHPNGTRLLIAQPPPIVEE